MTSDLKITLDRIGAAARAASRVLGRADKAQRAAALQAMAKACVSQAIQEATVLAAECFGAMGVMRDIPVPHFVNDGRLFVHSDISNTTAKLRVAEAIAGFHCG